MKVRVLAWTGRNFFCMLTSKGFLRVFRSNILSILNVFARCCLYVFVVPWICVYKFEEKPVAFFNLPVHIVQTQRFAFNSVITSLLTVQTLGSKIIIKCIVIYSSCETMLVSVVKLPQLAYWNCIYVGCCCILSWLCPLI